MPAALSTDRLHHVGVVVSSIEKATARYAEIFGLDRWDVRELGPDDLSDVVMRGRRIVAPRLRIATATSAPPAGAAWIGMPAGEGLTPVTFELIQPLTGESLFQEFRFLRRQGISHLKLGEMTEGELAATQTELRARGVGMAMSMTVDGTVRRHWFDTRAALGGYMVQVDVTLADVPGRIEVDHRDLSGTYARPDGVGPVAIFGVNHFGIVVDDVMTTIERYSDLLGVDRWTIRDWRTEAGSLECPHYRGQAVDHEYLTALSPFRDFGFEIIQPTHGPSHYNREFSELFGQGIHHMLLDMSTDSAEFEAVSRWLASIGVPVAMGGALGGGVAEFCYYDTSDALGGYILEAFLLREMPTGTPARESTDYVVDFGAVTANLAEA